MDGTRPKDLRNDTQRPFQPLRSDRKGRKRDERRKVSHQERSSTQKEGLSTSSEGSIERSGVPSSDRAKDCGHKHGSGRKDRLSASLCSFVRLTVVFKIMVFVSIVCLHSLCFQLIFHVQKPCFQA